MPRSTHVASVVRCPCFRRPPSSRLGASLDRHPLLVADRGNGRSFGVGADARELPRSPGALDNSAGRSRYGNSASAVCPRRDRRCRVCVSGRAIECVNPSATVFVNLTTGPRGRARKRSGFFDDAVSDAFGDSGYQVRVDETVLATAPTNLRPDCRPAVSRTSAPSDAPATSTSSRQPCRSQVPETTQPSMLRLRRLRQRNKSATIKSQLTHDCRSRGTATSCEPCSVARRRPRREP